ncbi:MAG TPA: homoserine dehydrogenase [Candidatus Aerophobetes bacterium]|uniref:Homoserine dehydrogenase n=1 Tax=Aerophobetes bacterium TaxID=2030807 RepID=A0A7V5LZ23_UNCAE|nr:homoserine dehydrogenase [Candidatus Aerophobetes bacterium]
MKEKRLHIGIFGLGTVGSGVVELLMQKKGKVGNLSFSLEKIVVKDKRKKRNISLPEGILSFNPRDILDNPKINTVIEVIGGYHPAKEFVMEALEKGKNVVTANKVLLATSGYEIFQKAAEKKCYLGVRASNIAAYRLIESLMNSPSKIEKLVGIFNGTCNFILTEMEKKEKNLSYLLKEAQEKGYAEPDPAEDINGKDTAHKLIVLLGLVFGYFPPLESIYVEGITDITFRDVIYAKELGYKIKLLAIAQAKDNTLEARVHPALIPKDRWLARLEGVENGLEIRDEIGLEIGMQAPGAGKYPTATAIIEDLICIAQGRSLFLTQKNPSLYLKPIEETKTKYYLKFYAIDKAGVLAKIANVLGEHEISIESVIQKGKEDKEDELVPIIMLTHLSCENNIQKALKEINNLPVIKKKPLLIRVEEGIF